MDDVSEFLNVTIDRTAYTIHQAGESLHSNQQQHTGIFKAETAEAVVYFIMQQWVAGATCVISLLIVLSTIAAGSNPLHDRQAVQRITLQLVDNAAGMSVGWQCRLFMTIECC